MGQGMYAEREKFHSLDDWNQLSLPEINFPIVHIAAESWGTSWCHAKKYLDRDFLRTSVKNIHFANRCASEHSLLASRFNINTNRKEWGGILYKSSQHWNDSHSKIKIFPFNNLEKPSVWNISGLQSFLIFSPGHEWKFEFVLLSIFIVSVKSTPLNHSLFSIIFHRACGML